MERQVLDEAYRKLKGSVYYDKTLPYIRSAIAEFEDNRFDKKINSLLEAINDEYKWSDLQNNIINSIKAFTFPKQLYEETQDSNEPIVISNVNSESICVEKYNNFIDISIEGHILSVLWILLIGYKIDEQMDENCFGNRLCDRMVFPNKRVSETPNLFKPYYKQYESWRNQGLEVAEKFVKNQNQSVIISMMDLTRYYYNINYTDEKYDEITGDDNLQPEEKRINGLMYKILQKYSQILGKRHEVILPLGFLPSNILSNAYLKEFDERIRKSNNVAYYGRYVDDMLLVTCVDPKIQLESKILINGVSVVSDYSLETLEKENFIQTNHNKEINLVGYNGLEIERKKLRFFYVDKNGYDTIIEKIRNDIANNTSEFNYLPESIITELNDNILQFEREDSINKLRSISGVSLDKYALSKAIGKNIMMSQFADQEDIDSFAQSLDQLLNHKEIIKNYSLWESIINYYVVNEKWDEIVKFSYKLVSALTILEEDSLKKGAYEYLKNNDAIHSVGDSLVKYYVSCLTRSIAIVWGEEIRTIINRISSLFTELNRYLKFIMDYEDRTISNMRKNYCYSAMINRYLLPLSINECLSVFSLNDKAKKVIRFNQLDDYLHHKHKLKKTKGIEKYKENYKPFISSPFEILYTQLLKEIRDNKTDLNDDNYCLKKACSCYAKNFNRVSMNSLDGFVNGEVQERDGNIRINVETQGKPDDEKYRIAVANVQMSEKDFEDILNKKKRVLTKRCQEISRIINEAIRYNSDILIFPEAYIPKTFLPMIQAKAAKHNMAIIGGIEHIIAKRHVYNLTVTLLPIVNSKMKYSIPFFHSKVYYSPAELKSINEKHYTAVTGKSHTLFSWKEISFITYCCYELTSLEERSKFKREADIVFGVEWNRDINYFSNIIESLSRDRLCYCIQSNMSTYGDSRIVQPTKSLIMDIAHVKGGVNGTVIIDDIDVKALRKHKSSPDSNSDFKPLPAGY